MTARITAWLVGCSSCCSLWGCTEVNLGPSPEFLWWTDHEFGDLSAWQDDSEGYAWTAEAGTLQVVTSPTRSGRFAVRSTVIATNNDAITSCALVARRFARASEAFYSAWFFIPELIGDTEYWLFFKFRAPNENPPAELWDLDLGRGDVDGLPIRLYQHGLGNIAAVGGQMPRVPVGRWFQTEAYLRAASDGTGQLTIWVDGNLVFDVPGITVPASGFEWNIGGATEVIDPSSVSLYFDDAAITTRRLGADFPPFWRGS